MAAQTQEQLFAAYVAAGTGLDPRVILTQMAGEGAPGNGPGYYNYLNIATSTALYNHSPVYGTGPAGTAKFGTMQNGVNAAIAEYNALGISKAAGAPPAQQIETIANSGWASGHYGNPPGSNLIADFEHMFPGVNINGPGVKVKKGPDGFIAIGPGGIPVPQSPTGASQLPGAGAAKGAYDAAVAVPDFLGKISSGSFLLRAGEVLAGGILVFAGLIILAKQVGLSDAMPSMPSFVPIPV
jgi:hypothetical protein